MPSLAYYSIFNVYNTTEDEDHNSEGKKWYNHTSKLQVHIESVVEIQMRNLLLMHANYI